MKKVSEKVKDAVQPIIDIINESDKQKYPAPNDTGSIQKIPTGAVPVSSADSWIDILVKAGRPMEEIQKFIDMRNEEIARLARLAFKSAKTRFLKDVPAIIKNRSVNYQPKDKAPVNYEYAELAHVIATVKDAEAEAGLSHDFDIEYEGDLIWLTCILSHAGGHEIRTRMRGKADITGNKQGIQADASTISYLKRYTLLNALGLAAGGDDDDGIKGRQADNINQEPAKRMPDAREMNKIIVGIMEGKTTFESLQEVYYFTPEQIDAINSVPKNREVK